jgi:hypothetical protein
MSEMRDERDTPETRDMGEVRDINEARDRNDTRDMRDETATDDMREQDRERMTEERSMPGSEREPVTATGTSTSYDGSTNSEMWPDMTDLRQKFDAIQSEFIEDPKGAVKKAEDLVREVVDRITNSMNNRMETMHRDVVKTNDTEQLRQTMRGYRELVVWMDNSRRAA